MQFKIFITIIILIINIGFLNSYGEEAIPGGPEIFVAEDEYVLSKNFLGEEKSLRITIYEGWELIISQEIPCGVAHKLTYEQISGVERSAKKTLVEQMGVDIGASLAQIGFSVSEKTELKLTLSEEERIESVYEIERDLENLTELKLYQFYQKIIFTIIQEKSFDEPSLTSIPIFNKDKLKLLKEIIPNCGNERIEVINPTSEEPIPSWIKQTAKFWVDGVNTDDEFTYAIKWFIENDVIQVPYTEPIQGEATAIPSWIKNTVSYWIEDISSDAEFISAIQHLIKIGIIRV